MKGYWPCSLAWLRERFKKGGLCLLQASVRVLGLVSDKLMYQSKTIKMYLVDEN